MLSPLHRTFVNRARLHAFQSRALSVPSPLSVMAAPKLLFRQLFESESSTYTYLLADEETKDAILIDPVLEKVDR